MKEDFKIWLGIIIFVSSGWILISQLFDFNPFIIFSIFSIILEIFGMEKNEFAKAILALIILYLAIKILDSIFDKIDEINKKK